MADFQDLDHIDGLSISVTSANLYNNKRDDLVLFYFRDGAEHASVYTKSKVISENIKWNLSIKGKKIKKSLTNLVNKVKYTQNKPIWIKAALGITTTDLKPKLAMEECNIGNSRVKIYGIAKGSGMIFPNMATTLGYIFTDAELSNDVLSKLLKKNIETTFNAISCDGDTSTNDMVTIFSTGKIKNTNIKNINDEKIKEFDKALHSVLLIFFFKIFCKILEDKFASVKMYASVVAIFGKIIPEPLAIP